MTRRTKWTSPTEKSLKRRFTGRSLPLVATPTTRPAVLPGGSNKVGSTEKAKVRDAIEQTKNVIGVNGIFNMTPTDHLGLTAQAFHMVEVRNHKWKLLY